MAAWILNQTQVKWLQQAAPEVSTHRVVSGGSTKLVAEDYMATLAEAERVTGERGLPA